MTASFKALLVTGDKHGQSCNPTELTHDDLMDGDVTIAVSHSSLNYKDALAVTGRAPVVRRFPMVPGIDFAGTVEQSANPDFHPGDKVLLTGHGVGESHHGGYAQKARVRGEWLVPLPPAFTPAQAMAIGTAGFTAMLAVMALEDAGLTPERGPIVVTGATGGVGSIAILLLARAGFLVIASTGRPQEEAYLKSLGASEILVRNELDAEPRPLGKERWAGGIDAVGSRTLVNLLSQTSHGGAVAACGLAGGMALPASVAPFILRGISLLGIDSVQMARPRRLAAWQRLARDMDLGKLATMTGTITLAQLPAAADALLAGRTRGRSVVEL
jgi:acrylyl-CoA reductase (NADPH)